MSKIARLLRGRAARGYVVLVVLLMLVVITTIVVGQLNTASHELVTGVHAEEEVAARGAAEGCLALMTRYAERFMNNTVPCPSGPPCRKDFDELLDTNDNKAENAGDYLPSIGTLTYVNGSTPAQAWKFLNRGGNSACLVRFDDNSDDSVPAGGLPIGAVNSVGVESDNNRQGDALRDVPYLDRDRAIFISAIGLYPYVTGSGTATAYRRAHARVTLRRLLAVSNPLVVGSSGVTANDIDVNNNATICGVGGMSSNSLDVGSNGCYCGLISTDNLTGTIGTGGCAACTSCNATGVVDPGPIPPPTVEIPAWSRNFMHAEGWGAPIDYDTPTPNPAPTGPLTDGGETPFPGAAPALSGPHDSTVCSFRGRNLGSGVGEFFVWDAKDTNAVASVVLLGPTTFNIAGVDQLLTPGTADCTSSAEAIGAGGVVRDACSWLESANTVSCTASQSPCWKLIGRFGDGTPDIDMSPAMVVIENSDSGFNPNKNIDIPNVANNKRWAVATSNAAHLCGLPAGTIPYCSSCNGTNQLLDWDSDEFEFQNTSQNTTLPGPAVFAVSSGVGRHVHVDNTGGTAISAVKPLHATILTGQELDIGNTSYLCGAKLLCEFITGAFDQNEANDVHRFPAVPPAIGHSRGFAMKSPRLCEIGNSSDIWGDARCGTFKTNNSFRMIGNIGGYDDGALGGGTAGECNTSGTCDNAHLCMNNAPTIVGNIAVVGDAELNNSGTMTGRLFVDGSVCGNNNFVLNGALIATDTFEMNNNLIVNVNGNMTVGGTSTFFSPGTTSYMEGSW